MKGDRNLGIVLFFLFLVLLFWLIVFGFGYITYISSIVVGAHEFEQHRIQGFKSGFYMGAVFSYGVAVIFLLIIHYIKKLISKRNSAHDKS